MTFNLDFVNNFQQIMHYKKAYDTVNHHILLAKLYHYGIRGTANAWFSSYISTRNQSVVINGVSSSKSSKTCGVYYCGIYYCYTS